MKWLAGAILGLLVGCTGVSATEDPSRLDRVGEALQTVATENYWCRGPCGTIVESPAGEVTAWAMLDTKVIRVSAGMMEYVRNDDELAFVVAHELAHIAINCATCMSRPVLELTADSLAVILMGLAGYDALQGIALLERMDRDFEWVEDGQYPAFSTRVEMIQSALAKEG